MFGANEKICLFVVLAETEKMILLIDNHDLYN